MCVQLQRSAESHAHNTTPLTPDPLPRFTNTEYEDHICMSNQMSTHHQPFVTEGSTIITKKKPVVTCSRNCEKSEGDFPEVTRRPRVEHLVCVMFAPKNSKLIWNWRSFAQYSVSSRLEFFRLAYLYSSHIRPRFTEMYR